MNEIVDKVGVATATQITYCWAPGNNKKSTFDWTYEKAGCVVEEASEPYGEAALKEVAMLGGEGLV